MAWKIEQDRDACIGCGACASICPDNWKMESDGKSKPIKTEIEELGCNKEAADACPVQCIKIEKA
ncbi:MAG TPA: ferredoxin [Candidatus Aenigmarchaeota archaeon]|nr:MAG: ferredoxin [Candidatus Aenigmarchaeota archaeon]HDD45926.1 ferredoxin [Candidatus Aenigmarchaeota archaeon]